MKIVSIGSGSGVTVDTPQMAVQRADLQPEVRAREILSLLVMKKAVVGLYYQLGVCRTQL